MRFMVMCVVICVISLSLAHTAHARRKPPDSDVPVSSRFVCSELCHGNESIYVYEGVHDDARCREIGGEIYSHRGWEMVIVCKVMDKRRCAQLEGSVGEFHFPLNAKNFMHLGCADTMTPDECRALLRESYADRPTINRYFMNNIGCMVR